MRNLILAAALAVLVPAAAQAAPARSPSTTTRAEAAFSGVWIGALVFFLGAALIVAGYSSANDGPPASP